MMDLTKTVNGIQTLRNDGNHELAIVNSLMVICISDDNGRKLTGLLGKMAKQVTNLMFDKRSINAVDTCIRYGNGHASESEIESAGELAMEAMEEEVENAKSSLDDASEEQKKVIGGSLLAATVACGAAIVNGADSCFTHSLGVTSMTAKAYCCVYPNGKQEIDKIISDLCWDCLNED